MTDPIRVLGPAGDRFDEVLTAEALAFVAELQRRFEPARRDLLARRARLQHDLNRSANPSFLAETGPIREKE